MNHRGHGEHGGSHQDAATPAALERAAARIDAVSRAASYLDANVNVPLVFQQLAGALSRG